MDQTARQSRPHGALLARAGGHRDHLGDAEEVVWIKGDQPRSNLGAQRFSRSVEEDASQLADDSAYQTFYTAQDYGRASAAGVVVVIGTIVIATAALRTAFSLFREES